MFIHVVQAPQRQTEEKIVKKKQQKQAKKTDIKQDKGLCRHN